MWAYHFGRFWLAPMLDQHRRDGVENAPNVGPKAVGRPSGRSSLSHLGDTVGGGLFF